jgi:hypothetical protein
MKARCIVVAFFVFVASGSAKDLVIERIVIKKHPIPAPYYVYFAASANAGRSEASYHVPNRKYESRGLEGDIEIPVNLTLKDVQEREWATVTLHIDNRDEEVTTSKLSRNTREEFKSQIGWTTSLGSPPTTSSSRTTQTNASSTRYSGR